MADQRGLIGAKGYDVAHFEGSHRHDSIEDQRSLRDGAGHGATGYRVCPEAQRSHPHESELLGSTALTVH